jgi:hypothetical protein
MKEMEMVNSVSNNMLHFKLYRGRGARLFVLIRWDAKLGTCYRSSMFYLCNGDRLLCSRSFVISADVQFGNVL